MNSASWIIKPGGLEADRLHEELRIPPVIARILVNRGIKTLEEARRFLFADPRDCHDPYLLKGMDRAVERIRRAVHDGEKILIFGDYDVDGILSVVMLLRALGGIGGDADYFIPGRLTDGYGIKERHLEKIREMGATLIISVDCGIKAVEFVRKARSAAIDMIITDHHMPGETLPDCVAVLDPVVEDSGYPDRNLAGVGVTFKLIEALLRAEGREADIPHYLKLVCIGTVADVVELKGENRIFVKFGMEGLNKVSNDGLKSLIDACGLGSRRISEGDLGFRIGPRINAAGRLGQTDLAVKLFFSRDPVETGLLVKELEKLNSIRQKTEEKILGEAKNKIIERGLAEKYRCIILGSEDWHRGVIGIVASKLKDFFHRPVLLFTYEGDKAYCSGRSIPDVPLIEFLNGCSDILTSFGGHKYAAGCTLPVARMADLKDKINKLAEAQINQDMLTRRINIDAPLNFTEIDSKFIETYRLLSPFGVGNSRPLFMAEQVEVRGGPFLMKDKHVKFLASQDGRFFEVVGWEMPEAMKKLSLGRKIDLVFYINLNEYLGESRVNLFMEDFRP